MKKLTLLVGLMMGLHSGSVLAEGQTQAATTDTTVTAEAKAKDTCTQKGLTGTQLDECVKKELQAKTPTQTQSTATQPAPQPKPAN